MQRDWLGEPQTQWRWLFALFFGLFGALNFGLFGAGIGYFGGGIRRGLLFGICAGLFYGIYTGCAWLRHRRTVGIPPTGILALPTARLRRGWLPSMLLGILIGGFSGWFFTEFLGLSIFEKIGFGISYGLIGGYIGWQIWRRRVRYRFQSTPLEKEDLFTPNDVIDHLGRYGLIIGFISGLLFGLGYGLIAGPLPGLLVGMGLGPYFGYRFGGGIYLHHYLLRVLLWRNRSIPWNLVAFLNEVTERLLLYRVGGGYIFVHRLLLEYFATLDEATSSEIVLPKDGT
jgi:hypothetical protein